MSKKPGLRFTTLREWGVTEGECTLCGESRRVFWFDDNEGYSTERLCVDCLRDAVVLIEEPKLAGGDDDAL